MRHYEDMETIRRNMADFHEEAMMSEAKDRRRMEMLGGWSLVAAILLCIAAAIVGAV